MTPRLSFDPPLASPKTWAWRSAPSVFFDVEAVNIRTGKRRKLAEKETKPNADAIMKTAIARRGVNEEFYDIVPAAAREAQIEAIFHDNMKRRDAAAAEYGEPETPHEFYAGRPGSRAEKIVCDCLRELRAIPEADNRYAKELTDAISTVYQDLAWHAPRQRDAVKIRRRVAALWRLVDKLRSED